MHAFVLEGVEQIILRTLYRDGRHVSHNMNSINILSNLVAVLVDQQTANVATVSHQSSRV